MASEAISSSILLIGAIVGAAFLITAILPAIFSAGDTFGTVSSSAESKMRTDFQIVNTYASATTVKIWMKNTGSNRIASYDLTKSSVFYGKNNAIDTLTYNSGGGAGNYYYSPTGSQYWGIGETMAIIIDTSGIVDGDVLYFSLSLPNSVRRTITFSLTKYS
jgi:flagellar protein FlaG